MKNTPRVRFNGFSGEWKKESFEDFFLCFIPTNTLSRAALTFEKKEIRNIHYGDVLIKFGSVLDVEKENIPFIAGNTDELKSHLLKNGDIIFADAAEDETVGKCTELLNILDEKVVSGLHTIACRPNKSTQNGFLGYYLNSHSYRKQLLKLMQGIKVLSISKTSLTKTSLQTPASQKEQAKIGNFFKNIDTLIAKNQQKYEKLTQMKKALLEKMFPKATAKEPEIRFQGFSGEWEEKELKEIILINSGRDYKHLSHGTIPVYGTGGYILSVNKALSEKDNAVGIGRKGTIDRPYILYAPFWTVDTLFYVIPKNSITLNFLFAIFQKIDWKQKDESTGVPSLSKESINTTQIFLSKRKEQSKIGELFRLLDKRIGLQQEKIEKLKNMKHAFLEKMFV